MMIQMREKDHGAHVQASDSHPLTCEEFQAQMSEMIGSGNRDHEHLKTCKRCTDLLEELEYIAGIAKDLMQPVYEPNDHVWSKLKDQIEGEEPSSSLQGKSI